MQTNKVIVMLLNTQVKIGDKLELVRTTRFGKVVKQSLTVVSVIGNTVLFDNGSEATIAV